MTELVEHFQKGSATRRRYYSASPPYVGSVGFVSHLVSPEPAGISFGPVAVQPSVHPAFVPIATYAAFALRRQLTHAQEAGQQFLSAPPKPLPHLPEFHSPAYVGVAPPGSASVPRSERLSEPAKPDWWNPVSSRVREIAALPANWDSYGAARVEARNIVRALNFLLQAVGRRAPQPSLVALPDGGLQLEWHRGGMDIEVEFIEGEAQALYFQDGTTEWEGPVEAGFEEFDIARRLVETAGHLSPQ